METVQQQAPKLDKLAFSSFSEDQARKLFALKPYFGKENWLVEWEQAAEKISVSEAEKERLIQLQKKLQIFVRWWNEHELRERFIAPVTELIDFDLYELEVVAFTERGLSVDFKNKTVHGAVDWMVATGLSEPDQPIFFIHEYKREKHPSGDALGQLLAILYTAKLLNQQKKDNVETSLDFALEYGCFVIGRLWFFIRLKEQQYFVSKSYDSTELEDLLHIFRMLKVQKEWIVAAVSN